MSANLFNWPDYVGKRKERLEMSLRFLRRISIEAGRVDFIYMFSDSSGNRFVWFTDSDKRMEVGRKYQVKFTVKRHSNYKGEPQTVIERPIFR